ncbi:MAG: hypothetical protein COU11_02875 [Candidatus Harrisonbacteria bacterium CG10_big_fil_rev_8_21_14_0_10_49_15]|uniref:Uncharacterized protein n=1 Tax=Candidatus Harrisonbacteria bacterium CG10_big_fil_rev_8_21_14_0_10_49_15 TaxID=1974587 RepID=A0A2H0UKJ8_9BACT|nr:MAG: hypothetical protein COU11_02875 [Candidatus Harrisonbacteria bacterium CG10_big_fil_rev_8_21_14_0_10_49_15]
MSTETRQCQNCKQNFSIEPEDFEFYEMMQVPPPTFCPQCRFQRRFSFYNQFQLFRKEDAHTGNEIFSTFPAQAPIKIYENEYWYSDSWDPMSYGRDYDFSRPFFEQYRNLMREVPWLSRSIQRLVNSDYCNQASDLKNSYLCFNGDSGEECQYCISFNRLKNCMDLYQASDNELCYGGFSIAESYRDFFGCANVGCQNTWFSRNCIDCADCFGCINLRHKKYHIFNQPYTKYEYQKKIKEFALHTDTGLQSAKQAAHEFWLRNPLRYMSGALNEQVTGEYIWESKNVKNSYQIVKGENVRYSVNAVEGVKDSWDYSNWGGGSELMYEAAVCGEKCSGLKFCLDCWPNMTDSEYCVNCHSSSNLFACVGLRSKQYCIFNKQYSKEEYEELVPKIKAHMNETPYTDVGGRVYKYGEFFPAEFSPLAYNESASQSYLPLSREQAEAQSLLWRDTPKKEFQVTMQATDLPDAIADVQDSILKEAIACGECKRAYRIIPKELEFYRRFELPLPRRCADCRRNERLQFRNPVKQYERQCQCAGEKSSNGAYQNQNKDHRVHNPGEPCPNEFQTSYAPDREEIVYCESCYQQEVI